MLWRKNQKALNQTEFWKLGLKDQIGIGRAWDERLEICSFALDTFKGTPYTLRASQREREKSRVVGKETG